MPVSAQTICQASFMDIGALQQGETMDAATGQDGLNRLNNMVSSWRTQYGTVTAIQRTIFPLVENQQTYTIGLGGDFNVPKPSAIAGAGLWLSGLSAASSVTSITRSGYTATVTQTAHPFAVGDEAFISGASQIGYNGLQTVQSVPTANTYTFTLSVTPVTPATGTITAASVNGQPVEIPRLVITDNAYQGIPIKNLPNGLFTTVYYNTTSGPFGQIVLWPKPDTDANQLVLYLQDVFSGFANLTTAYDWPDNVGYAEALQYNLARRLSTPYGRALPPDIRALADESLGLIKRANNKLGDVQTDAQVLVHRGAHGYNINTDGYN